MGKPKDVLIETSPRWSAIMDFLERNGAREPDGMRMHQQDFSDRVAIPRRSLVNYLRRMEELRVIQVTRTTLDGYFGSPRGPNIYRLLLSFDEWEERAEHIARERLAEINAAKAAGSRQWAEDVKAGKAAREGRGRVVRPPATAPIDPAVLDAIAERYVDESDEDLFGW